jgi:hypothetical protein
LKGLLQTSKSKHQYFASSLLTTCNHNQSSARPMTMARERRQKLFTSSSTDQACRPRKKHETCYAVLVTAHRDVAGNTNTNTKLSKSLERATRNKAWQKLSFPPGSDKEEGPQNLHDQYWGQSCKGKKWKRAVQRLQIEELEMAVSASCVTVS